MKRISRPDVGTLVVTVALAMTFDVTVASAARAQGGRITGSAALRKQTKVSEDSARTVALREVPGGRIESGELERENGKLLYSFDIQLEGKSGVEEVQVDALTGKMLSHEHESPEQEKAEAAREKAAKKGAPRKPG